jgi:hypothetical protein
MSGPPKQAMPQAMPKAMQQAMPQPPPQQGGGLHQLVSSLQDMVNSMDSPGKFLYGAIMVVMIVYSSLIPSEYRSFADSMLGRVFGIAIVYGVVETMGWMYGLLTALAFLLLINGAPSTKEGFEGGGTVSQKARIGRSWFVEKVLGEDTRQIATDKVNTQAVQD